MKNTMIVRLQEITKSSIENGNSNAITRLLLKEFLQNIILSYIYTNSTFKSLIFYGGTCLRKLYGLDRFSEDLDFESREDMLSRDLGEYLQKEFEKEGMEVGYKEQEGENVFRITLKFPVLYYLGLSTNLSENLHIKIEINKNIKGDYDNELTPYSRDQYSCVIRHYTLEVLMAGKMVACVDRDFKRGKKSVVKGRDFYDLIWYFNKNVAPDTNRLKDWGYTLDSILNSLDTKVENIKKEDLREDLFNYFANTQYISDWCDSFKEIYSSSKKRFLRES